MDIKGWGVFKYPFHIQTHYNWYKIQVMFTVNFCLCFLAGLTCVVDMCTNNYTGV